MIKFKKLIARGIFVFAAPLLASNGAAKTKMPRAINFLNLIIRKPPRLLPLGLKLQKLFKLPY